MTGAGAAGPTPVKGPFQSFPYWAVCWLLFFLLMFLFGAGPFAALIFFTIPIYHWVARALDGDWARGDIQVGPARRSLGLRGRTFPQRLTLTWLPRPPLSRVPKKVMNDEALA